MLDELLQSPALPLLTFLLGLVIGHWLAINRDQRKEYNELVTPLRKKVSAEAKSPSPMIVAISRDDAYAIRARFNVVRRVNFMKACDRYWKAKEDTKQDEFGQSFHPNQDAIREAAKQLLKNIPIR